MRFSENPMLGQKERAADPIPFSLRRSNGRFPIRSVRGE
ncbi:hypothetical protein Agau_L100425 [Agrobacterium tumefaciens F2]|nr:hypothetical protein Agau_L100425 [Agrobacterium tumefaciens F2]